jgi:hypothetical protein
MAKPQGGLQPLIGFAMHALSKENATVASVTEQMHRIAQERGWPPGLIEEAVNWAITNRQATLAARTTEKQTSFAIISDTPGAENELFGVRVVFVVFVDNPPLPPHYETVSVVINVPSNWTPEQALLFAKALWAGSHSRERYGEAQISEEQSPGIVAVYEGGYERAVEP